MTQSGGTINAGVSFIGYVPTGISGSYVLENNATLNDLGRQYVEFGVFTQSGTSLHSIADLLVLADQGIYNLRGGSLTAGGITVNNSSTFVQTGGTVNVSGPIINSGDFSVAPGTVAAAGTFAQLAGTLDTGGTNPGSGGAVSTNIFNFQGGVITGSGLRLYNNTTNSTALQFNGGTQGTFVFRNSGSIAGPIPAGATVIAQGSGDPAGSAVTVSLGNGLTNAGALALDASAGAYNVQLSSTNNTGVLINNGTLSYKAANGGTVNINGTVANYGTISGLDGIADTLTVRGLTLNTGGIVDLDLGAPGTSDSINVTNLGLNIAGATTLNLTNLGGLGVGNYTLFTYAGSLLGSTNSFTIVGPQAYNYLLLNAAGSITLQVSLGSTAGVVRPGTVNFSDPNSWANGQVPNGPSAYALIDNDPAAASSVNLDQNATLGYVTLDAGDSLSIGNGRTLTLAGPTTTELSGSFTNNNGVLKVTGGTTQILADGLDASPTYYAAAGATIDFHAGNHTNIDFSSADFTGSGGTISLTGGSYSSYNLNIAQAPGTSVTVAVSAGTLAPSSLHVGAAGGGVGSLTVSGTGVVSPNAIQVANGSINQSGGTINTGALYMDTDPAAAQQSTFSGGSTTLGTNSTFGAGLLLGNSPTTEGRIYITGTANVTSTGQEFVGYTGNGTVTQDGGTNTSNTLLELGAQAGSTGTYNISGGRLDANGSGMVVGDNGTGNFTQSGNSNVEVHGDLHAGVSTGSSGTYTLDAGNLTVDGSEYIAQAFTTDANGTGAFVQHGGNHVVNNQLQIGQQAETGTGTYTMDGGTLTTFNGITVGPSGTFTQSGGTVSLSGDISSSGGYADLVIAGTYNLHASSDEVNNPTTLTVNHFEYVYNATGAPAQVIQTGGNHTINGLLITGRYAGTEGDYTITGGNLSALNVYVGGDADTAGGTSTFTIGTAGDAPGTGGRVQIGYDSTLDTYTGSIHIWQNGTFIINDGGELDTGSFVNDGNVYENGGTLVITSGSNVTGGGHIFSTGGTIILDQASIDGQDLTISGSSATADGVLTVGKTYGNLGILNITAGSLAVNGVLGVGNLGTMDAGGGSGNVNVSGGSLTASTILLGSSVGGTGTLTISGTGSVVVGGGITTNDLNISRGSLVVLDQDPPPGEDPVLDRSIVAGYMHDGAIIVSGGVVTAPNIKVGVSPGFTGTYTQSGGTVTVTNNFLANNGPGTVVNINSGILNITNASFATGTPIIVGDGANSFTLNLTGGVSTFADGLMVSANSTYNQTSGIVTTSNFMAGPGSVINFTAGTLNVAAADFHTGSAIAIGDGTHSATLNLTGGTLNFEDGVVVAANANLVGTGIITGNVSSFGTIAPGHSPGETDITGDLTLHAISYTDMQLGGLTQGTQYDFIHVTGTTTLAGTLQLSFVNGFQDTITHADTFTILTSDSALTGLFSNVADGGLIRTTDGLGQFMVTYDYVHGNVIVSDFIAIPEPASLSVLGMGAIGLLARRRRRA